MTQRLTNEHLMISNYDIIILPQDGTDGTAGTAMTVPRVRQDHQDYQVSEKTEFVMATSLSLISLKVKKKLSINKLRAKKLFPALSLLYLLTAWTVCKLNRGGVKM